MASVIDLEGCPRSNRFYGGRAGQKIGILVDGEPWIAKYPRSGRDLRGRHVPSYTSSPVAEWLGSHIYASTGISVHDTMLGWHGGKVVCACRDFCVEGAQLVEFNRLKNTLSDDEDPRGHAIKPFDYLMSSTNPDLGAAVLRAEKNIDLDAVEALVDEVPGEAYGRVLMTDEQRTSHKRLLRLRYEQGIVPAAQRFRAMGLR